MSRWKREMTLRNRFLGTLVLLFSVFTLCISEGNNNSELAKHDEKFGTNWTWFADSRGSPVRVWLNPKPDHEPRDFQKNVRISEYVNGVMFYLYTRQNPIDHQRISIERDNLRRTFYDPKRPTKIVTHGYLSNGYSESCEEIRDAYLKARDVNVIVVDWGTFSLDVLYFSVAWKVKDIGARAGELLIYLCKKGSNPRNLHFIGHSLGAHVGGFAGKTAGKAGYKILRITGLDPASPSFDSKPRNRRLAKGASEFVDIIHTCTGTLGLERNIGDADFYPNGGHSPQPGCWVFGLLVDICSHDRSWQYFAESIQPVAPFRSMKCRASYRSVSRRRCTGPMEIMGEQASPRANVSVFKTCISNGNNNSELAKQDGRFGTNWAWFADSRGSPVKIWLNPIPDHEYRDFQNNVQISEYVNGVVFCLYTRQNPVDYQRISIERDNLERTFYDPKKPTKIVTHGYLSNGDSDTCQEIRDAYLKTQDVNVIVVDWGEFSVDIFYFAVASKVKDIGARVGGLLIYLCKKGSNPRNMHFIGHSLGAHVGGFAGKTAAKGGYKILRITGLDPASPNFDSKPPSGRLAKGDAEFVDVIHTCSGFLGLEKSIGDADFYPNGGYSPQPGCLIFVLLEDVCSHGRSWQYFAESIQPVAPFLSMKCIASYKSVSRRQCTGPVEIMGEQASPRANGIYYLETNDEKPFAMSCETWT